MNATPLTRRQQAILELLHSRRAGGLPPPTLPELCETLGLSSRGSLHKQVSGLIEAGLVAPMDGKQRGVRLLDKPQNMPQRLPMLGRIAAGRPIDAVPDVADIVVPDELLGRGACYVLQVRGDSMLEAGIFDGDWVVIESRDTARNGQIVVALIDGEQATLKRLEHQGSEIVLHAENQSHAAQRFASSRVQIQGVLVGQMRSYR